GSSSSLEAKSWTKVAALELPGSLTKRCSGPGEAVTKFAYANLSPASWAAERRCSATKRQAAKGELRSVFREGGTGRARDSACRATSDSERNHRGATSSIARNHEHACGPRDGGGSAPKRVTTRRSARGSGLAGGLDAEEGHSASLSPD